MLLLDQAGVLRSASSSVVISEPLAVVAASWAEELLTDTSEASWEEMESSITRESYMTTNKLLLMGLAGALAAVGLASNTLHLVVAGMVIAPGFEPLARLGLGAMTGGTISFRLGLRDTALGYLALLAGALFVGVALKMAADDVLGQGYGSYLADGSLVDYWGSLTLPSLLVSSAGAIGGAIVISIQRSILTLGPMIALSLVPAPALMVLGGLEGEGGLMLRAAERWAIDAVLVIMGALVVFGWKRMTTSKRTTALREPQ
jgi:uncharacterized membrane protein